MEKIAARQNPRSTTGGTQRSTLRIVCLLLVNRIANNTITVSRIGTSSNRTTCNSISSTKVELIQVPSPPGSSGSLGATDSPPYSAPDANKIPAAQAKAWATHADTVDTLMDLNAPLYYFLCRSGAQLPRPIVALSSPFSCLSACISRRVASRILSRVSLSLPASMNYLVHQ